MYNNLQKGENKSRSCHDQPLSSRSAVDKAMLLSCAKMIRCRAASWMMKPSTAPLRCLWKRHLTGWNQDDQLQQTVENKEEELRQRQEKRRVEAVASYHREVTATAATPGCRVIAKACAKAAGQEGFAFYAYRRFNLAQLQDALESYLGPPRWSMGVRDWRQYRREFVPSRLELTTLFHTDPEATSDLPKCRKILLAVRGHKRLGALARLSLEDVQAALEFELGFPRWSNGVEWRSESEEGWLMTEERHQAIRAYHEDPKVIQVLSCCRKVAKRVGLKRYSLHSLETLVQALEEHFGSPPRWKTDQNSPHGNGTN